MVYSYTARFLPPKVLSFFEDFISSPLFAVPQEHLFYCKVYQTFEGFIFLLHSYTTGHLFYCKVYQTFEGFIFLLHLYTMPCAPTNYPASTGTLEGFYLFSFISPMLSDSLALRGRVYYPRYGIVRPHYEWCHATSADTYSSKENDLIRMFLRNILSINTLTLESSEEHGHKYIPTRKCVADAVAWTIALENHLYKLIISTGLQKVICRDTTHTSLLIVSSSQTGTHRSIILSLFFRAKQHTRSISIDFQQTRRWKSLQRTLYG